MRDPEARTDMVGKGNLVEVIAVSFDHQSNEVAGKRIEHAFFHQILIHDRVELAVIHRVIDVTVDIVIGPAGRNRQEMRVSLAGFGYGTRHLGYGAAWKLRQLRDNARTTPGYEAERLRKTTSYKR